jgi:hypothetical protein
MKRRKTVAAELSPTISITSLTSIAIGNQAIARIEDQMKYCLSATYSADGSVRATIVLPSGDEPITVVDHTRLTAFDVGKDWKIEHSLCLDDLTIHGRHDAKCGALSFYHLVFKRDRRLTSPTRSRDLVSLAHSRWARGIKVVAQRISSLSGAVHVKKYRPARTTHLSILKPGAWIC